MALIFFIVRWCLCSYVASIGASHFVPFAKLNTKVDDVLFDIAKVSHMHSSVLMEFYTYILYILAKEGEHKTIVT